MSITEDHVAYVQRVTDWLRVSGVRAEADLGNDKIGYKIRRQTLQRIPFLLVAGARERDAGTISIRDRDGQDFGVLALGDALALLRRHTRSPDDDVLRAAQQVLAQQLRQVAHPEIG